MASWFQFNKQDKGQQAEQLAAAFLKKQGAKIVAKNYRCRRGEIDLIAQHDDVILFIEVKYRSRADYGGAVAAVDHRKQQRIRLSAEHYLQQQGLNLHHTMIRFDVIAIMPDQTQPLWLTNAFGE